MGVVHKIKNPPRRAPISPTLPTRSEVTTPVAAGRGRGLRVLWIDDDLAALHYAIRWLTVEGFQVETAPSGKLGLDLARRYRFDVIVLDERMPGMSGLELLQTLNAEGIRTPVMMLTAFGNARFGAEATRLGAVACYDKPLVGDGLVAAIVAATTTPTVNGGSLNGRDQGHSENINTLSVGVPSEKSDTREQVHFRLFPKDAAFLRELAKRKGLSGSAALTTLLRDLRRRES